MKRCMRKEYRARLVPLNVQKEVFYFSKITTQQNNMTLSSIGKLGIRCTQEKGCSKQNRYLHRFALPSSYIDKALL